MKKLIFTLWLALIFMNISAQQNKEKAVFKLYLRDGNVVSGTSESIKEISFKTDYGILKVPIKNVSAIVFGLKADVATNDKVKSLLSELKSEDDAKKSAAYEALLNMEATAISAIINQTKNESYPSEDIGNIYSIESITNFLMAKHGVNNIFQENDELSIDVAYKIAGNYDFKNMQIKTEFGSLDIPKNKINRIEVLYYDLSGDEKTFQLMASQHIHANENGGWLNTGIQVTTGQSISMIAMGEVVLASLSNGVYTPNGKKGETYVENSMYPQYGNLIYKIGETGNFIKAGAQYNVKASSTGILYLSIYETVYNQNNTGSYMVRVSVK